MIDFRYGVTLGALEEKDLEFLRGWRNDERVWRWCRQHDMIDELQQARWFERQSGDASIHMYGIYANGELVGVCGLTGHDYVNRSAEISIYIAPEEQGHGYAPMAFKTVIAHGFRNLNLHSIWCEVFAGNPVLKILYELGFVDIGTRREHYYRDGQYVKTHLLDLLEYEWKF